MVTKSNPSTHTDLFFPNKTRRRGEQGGAEPWWPWHAGPAMLEPGSPLRAPSDARRAQSPALPPPTSPLPASR